MQRRRRRRPVQARLSCAVVSPAGCRRLEGAGHRSQLPGAMLLLTSRFGLSATEVLTDQLQIDGCTTSRETVVAQQPMDERRTPQSIIKHRPHFCRQPRSPSEELAWGDAPAVKVALVNFICQRHARAGGIDGWHAREQTPCERAGRKTRSRCGVAVHDERRTSSSSTAQLITNGQIADGCQLGRSRPGSRTRFVRRASQAEFKRWHWARRGHPRGPEPPPARWQEKPDAPREGKSSRTGDILRRTTAVGPGGRRGLHCSSERNKRSRASLRAPT